MYLSLYQLQMYQVHFGYFAVAFGLSANTYVGGEVNLKKNITTYMRFINSGKKVML